MKDIKDIKNKKSTNTKLTKTIAKDQEMRLININSDEKSKYVTNFIKTAKYNL
jgi:hypothetical protein